MDVVILKFEGLKFILPGITRREKSVDSIIDVDRSNFNNAAELLERARFEVADFCTNVKGLSNSRDNIRANIFLPTMNHDFRGHTFSLLRNYFLHLI